MPDPLNVMPTSRSCDTCQGTGILDAQGTGQYRCSGCLGTGIRPTLRYQNPAMAEEIRQMGRYLQHDTPTVVRFRRDHDAQDFHVEEVQVTGQMVRSREAVGRLPSAKLFLKRPCSTCGGQGQHMSQRHGTVIPCVRCRGSLDRPVKPVPPVPRKTAWARLMEPDDA